MSPCACTCAGPPPENRERMESSAPHFMQTHVALSYPPSRVRRDMHQLLLHAVRHSSNTPSDKNKMLK